MRPYIHYSAEELALDSLFMRWVLYPGDRVVAAFWQSWLHIFPQCRPTVETARQFIITVNPLPDRHLSPEELSLLWARVRQSLAAEADQHQ
jgi:transmembrane sensor